MHLISTVYHGLDCLKSVHCSVAPQYRATGELRRAATSVGAVRALRCDTMSFMCLLYLVILTQPSFLQLVPYWDVQPGQLGCAKLPEQSSLSRKRACIAVRSCQDCERQCGREPGSDGKGSISKLLINVVSEDKPKVLSGLNQKVSGKVSGLASPRPQASKPPANR